MRPAPGPRGEVALLLLAGFGFGGGQQVLLREFVSLLYGEEVVLLLVTGAALLAASLGYRRTSTRATARFKSRSTSTTATGGSNQAVLREARSRRAWTRR